MSKITFKPHISGTGVISIEAPNTNTDRTLTIPDASGQLQVSGEPVTFPDGSQQFSAAAMSFRNKIINGNFDIWQRATSQTSIGYGSDDRWNNGNAGTTKVHSLQSFTLGQTDVPGNPNYFSRTVVSSVAGAANYCVKEQRIESVYTLAGKTATLSFYAKADAAKNIAVEFQQVFGSGGGSTNITISSTKILLSTTWQKYTVTINIPSIVGKTLGSNNNDALYITFWFDSGSDYNLRSSNLGHQSGTFDIARVQLEEGSVATDFEQRPIGLELSLCQRYYETSFDTMTYNYYVVGYKVVKRVAVVVSFSNVNVVYQTSYPYSFRVGGTTFPHDFNWYADAEL